MGELFEQAEAWLDQIEQTQDYTLPFVDVKSKKTFSKKVENHVQKQAIGQHLHNLELVDTLLKEMYCQHFQMRIGGLYIGILVVKNNLFPKGPY